MTANRPCEIILESHQQAMTDRYVTSVAPEPTNIPFDCEAVASLFADTTLERDFNYENSTIIKPINQLSGVQIEFVDDKAKYYTSPYLVDRSAAPARVALAKTVSPHLQPIDQHFRALFDVASQEPTHPILTLTAGVFGNNGRADRLPHFDYDAELPVISYKVYFLGEPGTYYPGNFRLRTKFGMAWRSLIALDKVVKPQDLRAEDEKISVVPAAKTVNIEPWNSYHSGPPGEEANGTVRGVLVASYNLAEHTSR